MFLFLSLWTVIQVKEQHWYELKKMEKVCKSHYQSNNQPYWKRIRGSVGPRQGLDLNESGQSKSELAWKNIPTRQHDHILGHQGSHTEQSSKDICSTLQPQARQPWSLSCSQDTSQRTAGEGSKSRKHLHNSEQGHTLW